MRAQGKRRYISFVPGMPQQRASSSRNNAGGAAASKADASQDGGGRSGRGRYSGYSGSRGGRGGRKGRSGARGLQGARCSDAQLTRGLFMGVVADSNGRTMETPEQMRAAYDSLKRAEEWYSRFLNRAVDPKEIGSLLRQTADMPPTALQLARDVQSTYEDFKKRLTALSGHLTMLRLRVELANEQGRFTDGEGNPVTDESIMRDMLSRRELHYGRMSIASLLATHNSDLREAVARKLRNEPQAAVEPALHMLVYSTRDRTFYALYGTAIGDMAARFQIGPAFQPASVTVVPASDMYAALEPGYLTLANASWEEVASNVLDMRIRRPTTGSRRSGVGTAGVTLQPRGPRVGRSNNASAQD